MTLSEPNSGSILLIGDPSATLETLTSMLPTHGYRVHSTPPGSAALEVVRESSPDLILLDGRVPGTGGIELCERLQEDNRTSAIPVIVLMESWEPHSRARVFATGCVDYVPLPLQEAEVLARVRTHLALRTAQKLVAEQQTRLEHAQAEHEQATRTLWEAEEQGRNLLKNLSDVIYAVDRNGIITYVSSAIEALIGYKPSEVTGRHFKDFVYEQDLPRLGEGFQDVLAGRRAINEYRVVTKSGEVRWLRTSSQPAFDGALVAGAQGVLADITKRKQIEDALRQERDYIETVLDIVGALVVVLDPEGRIVRFNQACERTTGYSYHEVAGKQFWDLFLVPEEVEAVKGIFAELRAGQFPNVHENFWVTREGNRRLIAWSNTVLLDEAGEVESVIGTGIDITEHRQAQKRIRQQNEFLTSVLESLTHPFYVIDANDYTIQVANAAARASSVSKTSTCYTLTHGRNTPCATADHPCPLEEIKRTKEPATVEHIHFDADGNERNVEVHGYPLFDEQGNVFQVIEYALDVTERRRAEEALRESEARWRSMAENSPDHVMLLDTDLNIQYLNYASPGLTVEEVIGTPLYTYVPGERQSEVRAILEKVLRTAQPTSYETEYSTPAGETIYYESRVVPRMLDDQVVGLAIDARDITEHKQVEQALREAKEVAERARREERERRQESERRRLIAESLADVLAALNSDQSLESILDFIVAQTSRLLGNQAVALYRLQDNGETLALQAARGLPVACVDGLASPPGLGALRQAAAFRQPVAVPHLATELAEHYGLAQYMTGEVADDAWLNVCGAVLALPIVVPDEAYGGMLLYHAEARDFSAEEVELATTFGDQVALAIQNARLQEQVKQAAATAERTRLARDLHDSVTQALFSASLVAEVLPQVWRRDADEALAGLDELRHLTRGALAEMRSMLLELRPKALVETKLDGLLLQLTEAVTARTELQATCSLEPIPDLPPDVHVTFYRIAQEALHNVVKHANAHQVTVSLRASPLLADQSAGDWQGQVILYVRDDGQGFHPGQTQPDRLGLSIMRERAAAVGAMLAINSEPGSGTQVSLVWHQT